MKLDRFVVGVITMPNLFAFAGACGTGKTTLMNEVEKMLSGLGFTVYPITEVARRVFQKYQNDMGVISLSEIRSYPNLYFEFQIDVLNAQMQIEDEALASEVDIVLSDRSVLDNLIYFLIWCTRETDPALFDWYIQTAYQRVFENQAYQNIFVVPPFGQKIDDGFRTSDLEYQKQQHQLVWMLTTSYNRSIIVEGEALESRKWFVLSKILKCYPNRHTQFTVVCERCGREIPYQDALCHCGVWWCLDCCQIGGGEPVQQEEPAVVKA